MNSVIIDETAHIAFFARDKLLDLFSEWTMFEREKNPFKPFYLLLVLKIFLNWLMDKNTESYQNMSRNDTVAGKVSITNNLLQMVFT